HLSQRSDLLHAGIESYVFVLSRVADNPDGIFTLPNSVNGFFDHVAQHDDPLVRRPKMFFGPVIDGPLTLLCDAILFMGGDAPPTVVDSCIDARLVVLKAEGFHDERLRPFLLIIRIESQPESHRIRVVHGNTEADRVVGYAAAARSGVSRVRWKYPVRKLRLGHTRYVHGDLRDVGRSFPAYDRPLHCHVRILRSMKLDDMRLIH